MSTRPADGFTIAAEVALAAVSVATVFAFSRLFVDNSYFLPVAGAAVASHVVSATCRRLGWTVGRSALVSALGLVLVITWIEYLDTTAFGVPTRATAEALNADADQAWATFQDVLAPAPVETGFVIALAIALWASAFLADWAAFRLWSPVEAVVPSVALFLFGALLGAEQDEIVATAVFLAALLAFQLLHHTAKQLTTRHWINADTAAGGKSLVLAGSFMALLALGAALLAGPQLPGAEQPAVVDWREVGDDNPARVTVSPMVSIRSQLVNQPDVEVFTVEADEPAYWRLTALDTFDGDIWKSSGSFEEAGEELPREGPSVPGERSLEQRVTIEALDSLWLPAAFQPTHLQADGADVVYEAETSTLIVSSELETSDGLTYEVTSVDPTLDAALLDGPGETPPEVAERFLDLPDDFDPALVDVAEGIVAEATTPYQQALALQEYFQGGFRYNDQVELSHDIDSIQQFLEVREGYCEQFAGTFAAFARAVGIPARVAVGFTWGDQDATNERLYHVTGRHAHAWPEVWLPAVGWVPFEPTPTRGNPQAVDVTHVAPDQADPPVGVGVGPTTPTTDGPTTSTSIAGAPVPPIDRGLDTGGGGTGDPRSFVRDSQLLARFLGVLAALAIAVAFYAAAITVLMRIHRRRAVDRILRSTGPDPSQREERRRRSPVDAPTSPDGPQPGDHGAGSGTRASTQRARLAWFDALEHLAVAGLVRLPSETPHEFGSRVLACTDIDPTTIDALVTLEVAATYGVHAPEEAAVEAAERAVDDVAAWVHSNTSLWQRVRYRLDPRPLLPRRQRVMPAPTGPALRLR
jgi:transglutaminase-like putative cysteine protease